MHHYNIRVVGTSYPGLSMAELLGRQRKVLVLDMDQAELKDVWVKAYARDLFEQD